jgi:WD40 repeat protein
MSRPLSASLLLFCVCLPPATRGAPAPEAKGAAGRTDRYGDPLPDGAVARLGTVRLRHECPVGSVAFSPDGALVAAGGTAAPVRVWDAATGQELARFKGKIRTSPALAFTPDGKTLLAASHVGLGPTVQHWDAATGDLVREVKAEQSGPFGPADMEFSPDLKLLAVVDHAQHVGLWDVSSGKRLLWLDKQGAFISVAVSHDGKTLATGDRDNLVHLWDAATGKELRTLKGHDFWVSALAFSPDDRTVVSAAKNDLRLWDATTGDLIRDVPDGGGAHVFSPDGKAVAAANGRAIRLLDVRTGEELRRFEGYESWMGSSIAFSPDGKKLAAGGRDNTVGLWDVATGKPLLSFEGHRGPVNCLAFSPDGRSLASGGGDHALFVWDLETQTPRFRRADHYQNVWCVAFSPDGQTVATGDGAFGTDDREAQVRLWDAAEGRLVRKWFGHLNSVQDLAFSPDGRTLATTGWDARVRLWDPSVGTRLHQIRGADNRKGLSFSADGMSLLVAGSYEGGLSLWSVEKAEKQGDLGPADGGPRPILAARLLPGGKQAVSLEQVPGPGAPNGLAVKVWDVAKGEEVRSFPMPGSLPGPGPGGAAFSPDGKTLALAAGNFTAPEVQLWDTELGKRLAVLRGHSGTIASLAFSPDGRTLASGGSDTTVLLWDLPRARLAGLWPQLAGDKDEAAKAAKRLAAEPALAVPLLKERLTPAAAREAPFARLVADLDSDDAQTREVASRRLGEAAAEAEFALRLALEGDPSEEVRQRAGKLINAATDGREGQTLRLLPDLEGEKSAEAVKKIEAMGPLAEEALRRVLGRPVGPPQVVAGGVSPRAHSLLQQALDRLKEPENFSAEAHPAVLLRSVAVLEQIGTPEARAALREVVKAAPEGRLAREAREALARLGDRE